MISANCPEPTFGKVCSGLRFCSTVREYLAERGWAGKYDGNWCPRSPAYRNTLDRAGIALPRADGTFDPFALAAAKKTVAAGSPNQSPCITFGELTGWRVWTIRDGYLRSPFQGTVWTPGDFMRGDLRLGFGVFAFKQRDRAIEEARHVSTPWRSVAYGSVRLWGDVAEHRNGYRAQFARITTLHGFDPWNDGIEELRLRYRV